MHIDKYDYIYFAVIVAIICCVGIIVGYAMSTISMRNQAIENNAAEWVCDKKTGKTKFVWKKIGYEHNIDKKDD